MRVFVVLLLIAGCTTPTYGPTTESQAPTTESQPAFVWRLSTGYNATWREDMFHDSGPPDWEVDLPLGTQAEQGWILVIAYMTDEPWTHPGTPTCSAISSGGYEPEYSYDCSNVTASVHILPSGDGWVQALYPLGINGTIRLGFQGPATIRYLAFGGNYTAEMESVDPERTCERPIPAEGHGIGLGQQAHHSDKMWRRADGPLNGTMQWFGRCG